MDREEILRRSREEGKDEWEEQLQEKIHAKENRWAVPLMLIAVNLFAIFGFTENWVPYELLIAMCIPTIVYQIYGYVKVRKVEHIFTAVVGVVAVIFCSCQIYTWITS